MLRNWEQFASMNVTHKGTLLMTTMVLWVEPLYEVNYVNHYGARSGKVHFNPHKVYSHGDGDQEYYNQGVMPHPNLHYADPASEFSIFIGEIVEPKKPVVEELLQKILKSQTSMVKKSKMKWGLIGRNSNVICVHIGHLISLSTPELPFINQYSTSTPQ